MTTFAKPETERALIALITHVDCLTCSVRAPVRQEFLARFEDLETLRLEVPDCGCHDPLSEWIIYSDRPLFPDVLGGELDEAAGIQRLISDSTHFEYVVNDELLDDLGIQS